jgi:hypothetical protein
MKNQVPCIEESCHCFPSLFCREEQNPFRPEAAEHDVQPDDDRRQERQQLGQAGRVGSDDDLLQVTGNKSIHLENNICHLIWFYIMAFSFKTIFLVGTRSKSKKC